FNQLAVVSLLYSSEYFKSKSKHCGNAILIRAFICNTVYNSQKMESNISRIKKISLKGCTIDVSGQSKVLENTKFIKLDFNGTVNQICSFSYALQELEIRDFGNLDLN